MYYLYYYLYIADIFADISLHFSVSCALFSNLLPLIHNKACLCHHTLQEACVTTAESYSGSLIFYSPPRLPDCYPISALVPHCTLCCHYLFTDKVGGRVNTLLGRQDMRGSATGVGLALSTLCPLSLSTIWGGGDSV